MPLEPSNAAEPDHSIETVGSRPPKRVRWHAVAGSSSGSSSDDEESPGGSGSAPPQQPLRQPMANDILSG